MVTKKSTKGLFITALGTGVIVFLVYALVCMKLGVVPFSSNGNKTLAWQDAYFQYLDFFSWFKDVLSGKQSLAYTFSSSLGQNSIGIFSYYLASPFSYLVVFFSKSQIQYFFNLMIGLKLATAGITMSVYLSKRFEGTLARIWVILLSVSYGLMQFLFSQSSNTMWIDGAYMLPLIMLGIYRVVNEGKGILLSISLALTIIFNWYTGGVNCLAAGLVFLAEVALQNKQKNFRERAKAFLSKTGEFILASAIGLMISAVLFLPTIMVMKQGRGSSFDWNEFRNEFFGQLPSLIHGYSIGEVSELGYPALFCGSVALIGCISYFITQRFSLREKITNALLVGVVVMSFFWRPLYLVFSLLKIAESYWYRYAYVACALIIFIAAQFYNNLGREEIKAVKKATMGFIVASLLADYIQKHSSFEMYYLGLAFFVILSVCVVLLMNTKTHRILSLITGLILCTELFVNGYKVAEKYTIDGAKEFNQYNALETQLVDTFRNKDEGVYRATEMMTRQLTYEWTTANYNESMAFNYRAIENYTSSPQNSQLDMFSKMGYPYYNGCLMAKNTFLLPVDSLVGVKYLMAPYAVRGVELMDDQEPLNGKLIYENTYALPFAFKSELNENSYLLTEEVSGIDNRFEYWNQIYQEIAGEKVDIAEQLDYTVEETEGTIKYKIQIPEGDYALYGDIAVNGEAYATLNLNEALNIPYARWQVIDVFNVPTKADDEEAIVTYSAKDISTVENAVFYGINLSTFGKITEQLQEQAVANLKLENGYVSFDTTGNQGEYVFTSIPYDSGWRITVNGEKVEPKLFENCLICVPLTDGVNEIEMNYELPGLKLGLVVSVAGVVLLIAMCYINIMRKHR